MLTHSEQATGDTRCIIIDNVIDKYRSLARFPLQFLAVQNKMEVYRTKHGGFPKKDYDAEKEGSTVILIFPKINLNINILKVGILRITIFI